MCCDMTMLPPDFGGKDFNSWKKRAGNITGEPVRFPKHVLQMKEGSFWEQRRSAAMESGLIRGWSAGKKAHRSIPGSMDCNPFLIISLRRGDWWSRTGIFCLWHYSTRTSACAGHVRRKPDTASYYYRNLWTGGRRVCRFTASPAQNAMLFAGIVTLVQLVFGGSGIVPAALVAILLNIILPKEKEA